MNNNKKQRIRLASAQQKVIATRYLAGETPDKLAKAFGVCTNNIRGVLMRQGAVLRDRSEAGTRLTHWKSAFNELTPEAKYWIGFLFADGSLYSTGIGSMILDVGLAARDIRHLEKFKKYLRSEHTITKSQNNNAGLGRSVSGTKARFTIRSKELAEKLLHYGMVAKSLERFAVLEDIANSRDFWRGLVDGDGWIGTSNGKAKIGVCGGEKLVAQFMAFLKGHGLGIRTSLRKQGTLFRVDFNSGTAVAIVKLLYADVPEEIVLDRKAASASGIINGIPAC